MDELLEKRYNEVNAAGKNYVDAVNRKNERTRKWETLMISEAVKTAPTDAQNLWYRVVALPEGRETLDAWRMAEVDVVQASANFEVQKLLFEAEIAMMPRKLV